MAETAPKFNPVDRRLAVDPFPIFSELRAHDPVFFAKDLGAWIVTGREEASMVLRRKDGDVRFETYQRFRHGDGVIDHDYFKTLQHVALMKAGDDHRRVRSAIGNKLSTAIVETLRSEIRNVAKELIDQFAAEGRGELMRTYADTLPMRSVSMLLDLGPEVERDMHDWVEGFNLASQMLPLDESQLEQADEAMRSIRARFGELVAARRRSPGDDLMSKMIAAADAGVLTEDELVANVWLLYVAAFDTTAMTIGNGIVTLLEHPEQLARLRADRSLLPQVIEEVLRYVGPVHGTHRLLQEPIELGGHEIPADTPIMVYFSGANHDESWCSHAEEFDIERRSPSEHLAFSDGPHKCPGRHLARVMVEEAIAAVFEHLGDVRVEELVWNENALVFRGPERLVLIWDPPTSSDPAPRR